MVNCPCKGRRCVCNIDGAGGIYLTGNGDGRQPYIPRWALYSLVPGDTSQADVTITGTGDVGDPWVITIDTLGGSVVQTVYTNSDTWVKTGGSVAQVVVIGGGGGGGGVANPSAAAGGSGGAGGAMSVGWFPLADLDDTVDVEVGQGGTGGQAVSGLTTGDTGGNSWFGEHLYAGGGRGGKSQASPAQTQHTTVGGTPPDGGPGGAGSVRDGGGSDPAEDHTTFFSPTGGGMGSGNDVGDTPGGTISPGRSWGGEGGDGAVSGFLADDGGDYGGGGGGGSCSVALAVPPELQTTPGGDGAQGVVVVTVW